jgi:thioredoxin 1
MSSALIKHTSDASFEADVLQAKRPVLVDYWAEWCGPCKQIAPILDELAGEYGERLLIAKMDTEQNRTIPAQYGIRSIPTLMLFKDGQLAAISTSKFRLQSAPRAVMAPFSSALTRRSSCPLAMFERQGSASKSPSHTLLSSPTPGHTPPCTSPNSKPSMSPP